MTEQMMVGMEDSHQPQASHGRFYDGVGRYRFKSDGGMGKKINYRDTAASSSR